MDFERLRELDYVGFAPYMGIYEQQPGIENHHKSLTKGIYTLMGNMMIDHWISGQTHVDSKFPHDSAQLFDNLCTKLS
jgi:hypothetical protein